MAATAIKTANGWRPLWTMSDPERPRIGWRGESRPGDEEWRDQQLAVLRELRARAA